MAAIETINEPLSGFEIKEILIRRFRALLDKDSTLRDDMSYPGFNFKLIANIKFHRAPTDSTLVWADDKTGTTPDPGDPETANDELIAEYETDIPAQARDENDLPHPVYEAGPAGPIKRRIHIPPALRRATKPEPEPTPAPVPET